MWNCFIFLSYDSSLESPGSAQGGATRSETPVGCWIIHCHPSTPGFRTHISQTQLLTAFPDGNNPLSLLVEEVPGGNLGLCEMFAKPNLTLGMLEQRGIHRSTCQRFISAGQPWQPWQPWHPPNKSSGFIPEGMEIHWLQAPKDQQGCTGAVLICHCSRNKWVMMRSWWEVVEFFASCKPEENAAQRFLEFDTRTWESHLTEKKLVQKSGGSCWGQKQEQIDLKELLAWFKICWSGGWWRPACQRTRKLHQGKTWIFWKCCEKQ